MKDLYSFALKTHGNRLWVLDQTRLPFEEAWLEGTDPMVMVRHIQRLAVRGAPLIGVSAALSMACLAESGAGIAQQREAIALLREARPTAVNLMWSMDRLKDILDRSGSAKDLIHEAETIFEEDVALCERIAEHGITLLHDGEAILTHCNTGELATAGVGTALGVIRRGYEKGLVRHVFVDETRPLLQGARLTAWELARAKIPYTLITDSMAAILMKEGQVQRVLVGADRIALNGDFANKVGTYGLAVASHYHAIPFHPVAPYSTVDTLCSSGSSMPIEIRNGEEVRGFDKARWAPRTAPVFNPAFDVTPVRLITSLVLDKGVYTRDELEAGALERIGRVLS
jgi:methylthioribose-1-phosphate isomerase